MTSSENSCVYVNCISQYRIDGKIQFVYSFFGMAECVGDHKWIVV